MALSDYKKFKEVYQKQGYMKAVSELEPKEPEKKPTKPLKDILKQIEPKKPTYDFTKTPEQNLIEQFKATAPIQPQKTPAQRLIEEPITRRAEISEAVSATPAGKYIINPAAGFGAGLLRGAGVTSLGKASGLVGAQEGARIAEETAAKSPIASTLGTVAGAILPGTLASKGAARVLSPVLRKTGAGPVAGAAATEALAGAGLGAAYAGLEGRDMARDAATGALLGGVGGALFAGLPSAYRALQRRITPEVTPTTIPTTPTTPAAAAIPEVVPTPQAGMAQRAPTPLLPGAPRLALPEPAIQMPPPTIRPTTLPGKLRLPGEKVQIKPTTLAGTLKVVNKEYEKVAKEYENAIQDIQNYFGTNELRASELARVKNELGIDLDNIVTILEKAESKALLPKAEEARLKRAAGISREEQYRLLEEITTPARTFDITEPQQVRGFINQDKLAQKFKIEREAAKIPEAPFPKVPQQFRKETPFTAFKGELKPAKPTVEEMAKIEPTKAAPPPPTKPTKSTKPTKPTKPPKVKEEPITVTKTPTFTAPKETIAPTKAVEKVKLENIEPKPIKREIKAAITLPGKQKISQTRLNTITRTTEFKEKSKKFLPEEEFGYELETAKIWKDKAISKYIANKEAAIDDLLSDKKFTGGEDIFTSSYVLKEAEETARKTNNYYGLLNLSKKYAEKIRENARALKAHDLAWEKKQTGTNTIIKAQRIIDDTSESILKANPKLKRTIQKELADVSASIKNAVQEASKDTVKAIKLNLQLFSQKQKETLEKMIGRHFTTDPLRRGEIVNKLVAQFGLDGAEAKALANRINIVFEQKFNKASESYLRRLLKTENKQDPTLDKIMKLIRAGAYDDISITNVLKEKHGLPVLTPQEAKKMVDMVDSLNKMDTASEEYSIQLAKIRSLIEDKEVKTWVDKQRAVKNIALLWNPATTLTNIVGNVTVAQLDITAQNTIGAAVDKLLSMRTGQRTVGFTDAKRLFSGAIRGARDATIDMAGGVRLRDLDGLTPRQKVAVILDAVQNPIQRPIFEGTENILELKRGLAFKGKNPLEMSDKEIQRVLGKYLANAGKVGRVLENQLYYSLNVFDKSAKRAHYQDTLGFLVKNNKGKDLDALKKEAKEIAIAKADAENITDDTLYAAQLKKYYNESVDSLVQASGSEEINALKRIAEHIAEERTFTDINTLSNIGRWVQALPQKQKDNPRIAQMLEFSINSLAPYITTPLNIVKRGVEYSPLGLTEGLAQLGRVLAKNEKITMARQRYIVDRISRGVAGTVLLMLGMAAYDKGMATGKVPVSKDMREFFNQIQIYPNSIKIGDSTIDLTKLQPLSSTFLAGVNFKKTLKEAKEKGIETGVGTAFEGMLSAIGDAFEFYTELPVLQSLKKLLPTSLNDDSMAEKLLNFALSVPQQYVPSLLRKASFVSDDYERFTKDPSLLKQSLINPIKRYVPGARETLPKQIGTLGQEVKSFGGKNSFWNVFFNPVKVGKVAPTYSQAEIMRLYDVTKDTAVFPNVYTKTIKLDTGKQKVLSAQQMMDYQRIMGENVNSSIEKLLSNPGYIKLPDTSETTNNTKLQAIQRTIENSVATAKKEMLKQLGEEVAEKKRRKKPLKLRLPNEPK